MNPLPTYTHLRVSSLCAHSQAPLSAEPSLAILPSIDPPPDLRLFLYHLLAWFAL